MTQVVTPTTELPPPESMICASCGKEVLLKDIAGKWRDKNFPPQSCCKKCMTNAREAKILPNFRDYYDQ